MTFLLPEDVLVNLRNCLCDEFATSPVPPGTCCITAGTPVIAECCSGFLWVRLVSAWPSTKFPSQDSTSSRCVAPYWAMEVEVGIARCAPEECGALTAACCAAELDVAMLLIDDFARIRKVLGCCLQSDTPHDDVIPGRWRVQGPQGGCITGSMTATVRWMDSCSC